MAWRLTSRSHYRLFSDIPNLQRSITITMASPSRKRQRLMSNNSPQADDIRAKRAGFLSSLSRPISPPPATSKNQPSITQNSKSSTVPEKTQASPPPGTTEKLISKRCLSPITLTRIRGLSAQHNIDTVSLNDILGNPLISEAWIFNFCFDVDWMMQHFDPDVRSLVKVKVIHGSWRKEDGNKIDIDEACRKWSNVDSVQAYLPDAFGTHHSKMFILFRHDMQAQVVIHTANMLEKDWSNMTQAVWRSPMLPLIAERSGDGSAIGPGSRFKKDLLRYLKAYGSKLKGLRENLDLYDFKDVQAALIASVPSKFDTKDSDEKVWGHISLQRAISEVSRVSESYNQENAHLICQISSIATLPAAWLEETILKAAFPVSQERSSPTSLKKSLPPSNRLSIIYPTPVDVAMSLDGYFGGGSIHTKAQSAAHLKQIAALRPHLHRWIEGKSISTPSQMSKKAHRHLAAPHIKTYISFSRKPDSSDPVPRINWALLTSANLSTQAWGTIPKAHGQTSSGSSKKSPIRKNRVQNLDDADHEMVHIQSYEIGVLLWPELFANDFEETDKKPVNVQMMPVFGKDLPDQGDTNYKNDETAQDQQRQNEVLVGFRMPYDLPLTPYAPEDMPWSPQSQYTMPDRHGRRWPPDASWFNG